MGLRAIVGATVTGFIGIYMLWFVIPATRTAYTSELAAVNKTSALMQTIIPITDNWWIIFPFLIILLVGYTIWQYASEYFGQDF